MNTLRIILAIPIILVLAILLISAPMTISATETLTQPEPLKEALVQADFYDSIVQEVMAQSLSEANAEATSLPTDESYDELMDSVITQLDLPTYLQDETETVIDETYKWLETPGYPLNIHINIDKKIAEVNSLITDSILPDVENAPTCSADELLELIDSEADIFKINCLPEGFDRASITDALGGESLFGEESFNIDMTEEDLGITQEDADMFKMLFSLAKNYKNILMVGVVLLVGLALLLIPDKASALITTGAVFLVASLLAMGSNFTYKLASSSPISLSGTPGTDALDLLVLEFMTALSEMILDRSKVITTILLGIGLLLLLGGILLKKSREEDEPVKKGEGAKAPSQKPVKSA